MGIKLIRYNLQKLVLGFLAALLYIQTYPPSEYALLVWIALIPWFLALNKNSWKFNTLVSFLFSSIIFLLYLWVPYSDAVFSIFDEKILGTTFIFLHLFSYMLPFIIFGSLYHHFNTCQLRDSIYLASLFTVLSMGLPTLFTYNMATSLYDYPLFLQVVDISGVSLLLWLIVFINLSLKNILFLLWEKRFRKDLWENALAVVVALSFIFLYGYWHLNIKSTEHLNFKLTIATIQPNMGNDLHQMSMIRDNKKSTPLSHIELSRKALTLNPNIDLIVWPEGGLLVDCDNKAIAKKLSEFTKEIAKPLIYQCNQALETTFYNQSRYIGATGKIENIYNKQNLIPFFEYIPKVLDINLIDKEFYHELFFDKGKTNNLFHNGNVNIIPTICYDAHSHDLIRKGLNLNGNLLILQSNDLIFKKSHIGLFDTATNIITAISFRLPMVKSSNSGYGLFLSGSGKIIKDSLTPINTKFVSVHTLDFGENFSLYKAYGDWFFWLSLMLVVYFFINLNLRGFKSL